MEGASHQRDTLASWRTPSGDVRGLSLPLPAQKCKSAGAENAQAASLDCHGQHLWSAEPCRLSSQDTYPHFRPGGQKRALCLTRRHVPA